MAIVLSIKAQAINNIQHSELMKQSKRFIGPEDGNELLLNIEPSIPCASADVANQAGWFIMIQRLGYCWLKD
jgi:hypothetical protein